jgi:RNA polymerase sigma factor (sigma-70 family)
LTQQRLLHLTKEDITMKNPKGTAAHEMHLVATTDKKRKHSPPEDKSYQSVRGIAKSAFDKLLETDKGFYRTMNKELADILVRVKIPPFLLEDLVQEAWLSAVQHGDLFVGSDAKRRLRGFLRKAVHDKAVDLLRHLDLSPSQSLGGQEMALRDEAEAQRAEMAEQHEWLEALLEEAGLNHEENKELVRAHFFQGVPLSELAQRLGMTEDAVDCRIRRLVERMCEKARKKVQQ